VSNVSMDLGPVAGHPRAKAPLLLANEGAGVIEDAGDSGLAVGGSVMFTGHSGMVRMARGKTGCWRGPKIWCSCTRRSRTQPRPAFQWPI
jgi:hypothetical protein